MDYSDELQWRLQARKRHRMPGRMCEFMRHAGNYVLVEWEPHPLDYDCMRIRDEAPVDARFEGVAERSAIIIDRFYQELHHPTVGFHPANVKQAILLSSGCLGAAREWMAACSAPPPVIEEMFRTVRDAVGALATCEYPIAPADAEALAEVVLRRMAESRRRADCFRERVFA